MKGKKPEISTGKDVCSDDTVGFGSSSKRGTPKSAERKTRRPDKVLYVPRARRQGGAVTQSGSDEPPEELNTSSSKIEIQYHNTTPTEPELETRNVAENVDKLSDENRCPKRPCEDSITNAEGDQDILVKEAAEENSKLYENVVNVVAKSVMASDSISLENVTPETLNVHMEETSVSIQAKEPLCESHIKPELTINGEISDKLSSAFDLSKTMCANNGMVKSVMTNPHKFEKVAKKRRESSGNEDSWDAKFDDNGDCLDPSTLEELTGKVGNVTISVPQIDYYSLETKDPDVSDDAFGHILEIYNFPTEYKTEDLISAFHPFKDRGFNIKWVDDTHALVLFSSRIVAEEACRMLHPIIKTRPLAQATIASKRKAKHCSEFMQPYKERPQTSTIMVHRLLSGALGRALPISKEKREEDRKKLKDAKERKRLAIKHRDDAWEGIVNSND